MKNQRHNIRSRMPSEDLQTRIRPMMRQRTTPWTAGIGPPSTICHNAWRWLSSTMLGVRVACRSRDHRGTLGVEAKHPIAQSAIRHQQSAPRPSASRRHKSPQAPKDGGSDRDHARRKPSHQSSVKVREAELETWQTLPKAVCHVESDKCRFGNTNQLVSCFGNLQQFWVRIERSPTETFDVGEDYVGRFGLPELLWIGVFDVDIGLDGGLELGG
jgi:hypothetical protein